MLYPKRTDLILYLVTIEHEVTGGTEIENSHHGKRSYWYDEYDDEEEDYRRLGYRPITDTHMSSLQLKQVVDMHGTMLATDFPIDQDQMHPDPFGEDRVPDEES